MSTPLYDALRSYAAGDPARFHMPGHKGRPLPAPELAPVSALDLTELGPTGNLYEPGPPFDQAQALWAQAFGFGCCQFLTGGSTQGIYTALALFASPGEGVLVDRGCHRSVYNALALLDLEPVFWERPWLEEHNVTGPFDPAEAERLLEAYPNVKTVCITSPTYSGVLSEVAAIWSAVRRRWARLVVDGAHGAHLPFLGVDAFSGADGVVVSAHKTLPALGQGALLFCGEEKREEARRWAALFGTSSPSYPILASLDLCRDWMEGEGREAYRRVTGRVAALRRRFPSLGEGLPLDPGRLTVKAKDGHALARKLEERGIFAEMADGGHVVFICTLSDQEASLDRLEQALEELEGELGDCPPLPAPPLPERVLTPRQALFARREELPLEACLGRTAACSLAPYPPGVPVVAPGEVIGKKELSYFQKISYNNKNVQVTAL